MATLREAIKTHLLFQAEAEREAAELAEAECKAAAKRKAEAESAFRTWLSRTEGVELGDTSILMMGPQTIRNDVIGAGKYQILVDFGDGMLVESNGLFHEGFGIGNRSCDYDWHATRDGYYHDFDTFAAAAAYALGLTLASFEKEESG